MCSSSHGLTALAISLSERESCRHEHSRWRRRSERRAPPSRVRWRTGVETTVDSVLQKVPRGGEREKQGPDQQSEEEEDQQQRRWQHQDESGGGREGEERSRRGVPRAHNVLQKRNLPAPSSELPVHSNVLAVRSGLLQGVWFRERLGLDCVENLQVQPLGRLGLRPAAVASGLEVSGDRELLSAGI